MLTKYPYLKNIILYRYSENLRVLRFKEKENYFFWIKASLLVGFNIKSFLTYLIYIISFKKIKK
jgi:hypothetical protein